MQIFNGEMMWLYRKFILLFILPLLFVLLINVNDAAILLPYGTSEGDQTLMVTRGSTSATTLSQSFLFFEHRHTELFISENGIVSFSAQLSEPTPKELDAERKDIVAVFYAPSVNGSLFFRLTNQSDNLLCREISAKIRRSFTDSNLFEAQHAVLITWENIQNIEQNASNTFQLALVANNKESYVVFVYEKLEWFYSNNFFAQAGFFSADGRSEKLLNSGTPAITDLRKITNFNEPGVFLYRVSGSQPQDPRHGITGLTSEYEYQPGEEQEYDPEEILEPCPKDPYHDNCPVHCNIVTDDRDCSLCICPDSAVSDNYNNPSYSKVSPSDIEPIQKDQLVINADNSNNYKTFGQNKDVNDIDVQVKPVPNRASDLNCLTDSQLSPTQCYANALCTPSLLNGSNSCCRCAPNEIGNGVECLEKSGPQRINGVFEAAINGKRYEKTDLFSYIQVGEGQQHTALARIPIEIGVSLSLLDPIGNVMGWLFAKHSLSSSPDLINGFQLTGGSFNRTVTIRLGDRYSIIVRQMFTDRKEKDTFNMNVFVSGTLPQLNASTTSFVSDFEQTYQKERLGLIRSYNERFITVLADGKKKQYQLTTDEQIHYVECPNMWKDDAVQIIKFSRNSNHYNATDNIVRFSLQALVMSSSQIQQQPKSIYSPAQSFNYAIVSPVASSMVKNLDIDECSERRHNCHVNATCQNLPKTFKCICLPGFTGDGLNCVQKSDVLPNAGTKNENSCTKNSDCQVGECIFEQTGQPGLCICRRWYISDGVQRCAPPEEEIYPLPDPISQQQCGKYYCDVNADCKTDAQGMKFCVCRNGMSCKTSQRSKDVYNYDFSITNGKTCRSREECKNNADCVYNSKLNYYKCECVAPFKSNGIYCVLDVKDSTQSNNPCKNSLNCGQNAQCVLNGAQPICQCLNGFHGDGFNCFLANPSAVLPPPQYHSVQLPKKTCTDIRECHTNAHCVAAADALKYICKCLPGYQGDGFVKCILSEECSASIVNSCPPHSLCQYSLPDQKFTCQCKLGFVRSGSYCVVEPITSFTVPTQLSKNYKIESKPPIHCLEDKSLCSNNAQCVPDERSNYVCNCNYGYRGNGKVCEPVHDFNEGSLLIARGMSIIQRSTKLDVPGKQLVVVQHQVVVDMVFDCLSQRIFWSDISGHSIRSVFLNGTNLRSDYTTELSSPEGIAIDWTSRNLYYIDSIKNELGVVSLNGKYQKTLLTDGLVNPRAMAIDINNRHIYYSDWHRKNPHIGRIDFDGTNNQIFLSEDVHLPNGLTLLYNRRELCWVDAGNQRLACVQLNGKERRVVYAPLEYPFGLTCYQEERFYWTDWKDYKIHSVSINGDGYISFLPGAGGKGKIYGILSVPLTCQGALTKCATNNGGCDYLCLPSQTTGHVCKCPDNVKGLIDCS